MIRPRSRRLGRFYLSGEVLSGTENPSELARFFYGSIILEARVDFESGRIEYLALNEAFDELPHGYVAPVYVPELTPDRIGPRWYK